jgi:nitrogen regulatory protein PII-like uncharacterized protein
VQPAPTEDAVPDLGGGALNDVVLGKRFATAASGMTNLGTSCNSVVSAETVMMVKERVSETLGPIRYTMSEGCSGGSMQQHWLASDYPGLLDGIQPTCSFPDIWETVQEAEDCHVLDHYFGSVGRRGLICSPRGGRRASRRAARARRRTSGTRSLRKYVPDGRCRAQGRRRSRNAASGGSAGMERMMTTQRSAHPCAQVLVVVGLFSLAGPACAEALSLRVMSNRADLVSGGDALVEVDGADSGALSVRLDGRDVTDAFARRADGRVQALITGLADGPNLLTVRDSSGGGAQLTITSHPIGGPVFAGAQTQPWICHNQDYGLGRPTDPQCDTPPAVTYQYRDATTGVFLSYDPGSPPAASRVASTTTDQGKVVPYVVRIERGVIDRGVYELAVLADPSKPWSPFDPAAQPGWNHKLYWTFGGDCNPDHAQADASGANADKVVSRGFLSGVASNTNLGSDCNSVVSAETLMMIKEHIAETYGAIRYTMSEGASGGSMQQNWITSDYPGLLDGIQPSQSFPDVWETLQEAEDCHLLDRVFDSGSGAWTPEKQAAVTGYASVTTCRSAWDAPAVGYAQRWLDPTDARACSLPADAVYDAQTNPNGVRCTLPDYMVSIFGHRGSDGFANRPFDNVGVQYGLHALLSGVISPEEFVSLNEQVGGLDIDWHNVPARSVADRAALGVAYRGGLVSSLREQSDVPVIDSRGADNYEIHTDFHSYVQRARLEKANGDHDNQIIWTGEPPLVNDPAATAESIRLLDRWLARIEADRSDVSLAEKVRRDRPQDAVDACWIAQRRITDPSICRAAFPYFSDPRVAAGGPGTDDVLKCRLRPLDRGEYYGVSFSGDQWRRLQVAFPEGICDYRRPGVAEQPSLPWMTFADGPGGRPLGDPPHSEPLAGTATTASEMP